MPIRSITHGGVEWTIWNVVPSLDSRVHVPLHEGNDRGWLCLQSADEKRRIVPAPDGWEEWTEAELARQLELAVVVQMPPKLPRAHEEDALSVAAGELRERVAGSIQRARDLGERVRQAMDAAGSSEGDWRERGPDQEDDR